MTNAEQNPGLNLTALANQWVKDLQAFANNAPQIKTRQQLREADLFTDTTEYSTTLTQQVNVKRQDNLEQIKTQYDYRSSVLQSGLDQRKEIIQTAIAKQREAIFTEAADKFVVAGQITDEKTGLGLAGIEVQVFDMDRRTDDYLGKVITNAEGFYRLEYDKSAFAEAGEDQPELYIKVINESGENLYESPKGFSYKAGEVEDISVKLDGDQLPQIKLQSRQLAQLREAKLAQFDQRKNRLNTRLDQLNSNRKRANPLRRIDNLNRR